MKILVPIKRVPDYQAKIKVLSDGSGIQTDGIKWIVNPFDEIAVEEALRLKEAGKATEIVIASIGPDDTATQIRYALAMGADRGILVKTNDFVDSDLASIVFEALYKREDFGLVILGKQAIDSDAGQTGQLLAARLKVPQACFASKVVIEGEGSSVSATVTREVDGGLETIKVKCPCVISTDLRLNEPRYAPLPGIMKAKKKPLEELELSALGLARTTSLVKLRQVSTPAPRQAGKKLENVAALMQALKSEAKVL